MQAQNDKIVNDDGEEFIVDLSVAGDVKADAEPLNSTKIELAGVSYTFPIRMSELYANGWALSEGFEYQTEFEADTVADLASYYLRHENGMVIMLTEITNDSAETKDISECLLTGIQLDGYEYDDDSDFVLPGGIVQNSTAANVVEIFGNPNTTTAFTGYSYNMDDQLTYTGHADSKISYSFSFYDDGTLYSVNVSIEE